MKSASTIAIIGAGHNGLTAAAYLAEAGFDVEVFEKRDTTGGLCVTEQPFSASGSEVKVSSVASYFGMLRKEIIAELELEKYGLKPYLTNPIEIVLLDDGQFSFTPREGGEARVEINGLTDEDKAGWQKFWGDIQAAAALIYPRYLAPDLTQADVVALLRANNLQNVADNIFDGSLLDLLKLYVSSEQMMAVAATCTPGFANVVGSVFGCIHHGTAETIGEFGAWGQVKMGMGEITSALALKAKACGARIYTGRAVTKISTENDRVCRIDFADGSRKNFDLVLANCDSYVLFERLLEATPATLKVRQYLNDNRPKVSAAKLHFLLRSLPSLATLTRIDHNHKGVIVIAPPIEAVRKASATTPEGVMPERLMLTMAFPTLEDPGMQDAAAPDNHVLTVDVHYLPARINGKEWSEADDQTLLEMTIKAIEEQCSEIRSLIKASFVVSPLALARTYNLASLSCWHMPMTPAYLFEKRSLPDCAPYETPVQNLYICGAGTYPGGNVTAANGHNAAKMIINQYTPGTPGKKTSDKEEVKDDSSEHRNSRVCS
jgi:phytoene dehydrogenase-like protein